MPFPENSRNRAPMSARAFMGRLTTHIFIALIFLTLIILMH